MCWMTLPPARAYARAPAPGRGRHSYRSARTRSTNSPSHTLDAMMRKDLGKSITHRKVHAVILLQIKGRACVIARPDSDLVEIHPTKAGVLALVWLCGGGGKSHREMRRPTIVLRGEIERSPDTIVLQ